MPRYEDLTEEDFCLSSNDIEFFPQEDRKSSVAARAHEKSSKAMDGNYRLVPDPDGFEILLQGKTSRLIEPFKDTTYIIPQRGTPGISAEAVLFGDRGSFRSASLFLGAGTPPSKDYRPSMHISEAPGWDTIDRWEIDYGSRDVLRARAAETVAEDQKSLKAKWSKQRNAHERFQQIAKILGTDKIQKPKQLPPAEEEQ